jgi:glutamate synthase (ferredoxin)
MTEIPWKILSEFTSDSCPRPGVAQCFLPRDETRRNAVKEVMEKVATDNGLVWLGWREVPTDPDSLGPLARASMPSVWQFAVKPTEDFDDEDNEARDAFEKTLYFVRRRFSVELKKAGLEWDDDDGVVYLPSFSSRTIVYKGMVQSEVLSLFYKDLQNPDYTSKFMIYHRRFSTNTTPKWPLAQPMRTVGHNGEINTLLGNVNWVRAREKSKTTEAGDLAIDDGSDNIVTRCEKKDIPSLLESVVSLERSDSANLDGVFELMCQSGSHTAPQALMAMVPTAYMENPDLKNNPEITDFYKFHGGLLEAWDGPALLVYSDGKSIGASLDRNGLRPARFSRTKDGTVYMMSETGVIPSLDEAEIVEKGRLGPGQMINVDLADGTFKDNIAIKSEIAKSKYFFGMIWNQC